MIRLWFNRTYSTNAHIIGMLRANPEGRPLHVIGTHVDPDSPVLMACDEAALEPVLSSADYLEWALRFAREHRVDVLVPREQMAAIAGARAEFAAQGTELLCPDAATIRLFADKSAAYRAAVKLGVPVPPFRVAVGSRALREAYGQMSALAEHVCVKPTRGVGGAGYRMISERQLELADFTGQVRARVNVSDYCSALDRVEQAGKPLPELLVMPYLTGPEISLDVVADRTGVVHAAVGRARSRRRRLIVDDPAARDVAISLTVNHQISYLSNTQVRYWQGAGDAQPRPYLLEVNTRISGGLFETVCAEVNLPWHAIKLAIGEEVEPLCPKFGAAFTTISSLLALK